MAPRFDAPETGAYRPDAVGISPYPGMSPIGPPSPSSSSHTLGALALAFSLIVLIVSPIIGAIGALLVGSTIGGEVASGRIIDVDSLLLALSPVRNTVLVLEIAFWASTILGIWAVVQGIIAIRRRRGRGMGVAAVIIAPLAAVAFALVVTLSIITGMATGSV